jgi:hypothetical protein
MAFAIKMWNWTRMGARVVVTPGEMTPARFSHPLLAAQKAVPQPPIESQMDAPSAPKSDKASQADTPIKPAVSAANLELRSTVGHGDSGKPASAPPLRDQTHTADARAALPTKASVTISDAAANGDAGTAEATGTGSLKPEEKAAETKFEVKTADVKAEASKPDALKSAERPGEILKATVAAPTRSGQISVLISRKDSKLYARQNFAPLFEVPIAIAPSDRPLGTHVFTAQVDKGDANVLHWSVVSLPAPSRYAERRDEDERASRRRKMAGAVEVKAVPVPNSPTEALDRLTIPADAMARITEALSTGGSIIVSDQGIAAGETGEGTDFIVSLR